MGYWISEQRNEDGDVVEKIAFDAKDDAYQYASGFTMFDQVVPYYVDELPRDAKAIVKQ